MSDQLSGEGSPTEESGSIPTVAAEQDKRGEVKRRAFLSSAMRDLREEELDSPAARRFLIAEIERLDRDCDEHKDLGREHNDLRVKYARLEERSSKHKWLEVLSFVATTVGAAGLGAAPSYISTTTLAPVGWVFAIGSALLVISGVAFRVLK